MTDDKFALAVLIAWVTLCASIPLATAVALEWLR